MRKIFDNHHVVLWTMFVVAFMLRGWDLSSQPALSDEVAAAYDASNYVWHGLFGRTMWYHPTLRNVVVYLSGVLFGEYSAWGLRFGSLAMGTLEVPVLGYLSLALFRNRTAAYLAALFLCIDPLNITLSREAFQETTTSFFIVAGVLAAYNCIRKDNIYLGYVAGILFGLASASKWHGLFPWFLSAVVYLFWPWINSSYQGQRNVSVRFLNTLAAFVAIPVTIYVAVHWKWLLRGYSISEFFDLQAWFTEHQYHYRSEFYTEDYLSHSAYQWFLWPVAWVDFVYQQGKVYLAITMGNFVIWALTLPSLLFFALRWIRRKQREFPVTYVAALFLISYLPLVLTSRSIWVFSAPAVIPFAFLLSSYMVAVLFDSKRISRRLVAAYLCAALLFTAAVYPMATFRTLDYQIYGPLAEKYSPHEGWTAGKGQ